VKDMLWSACCRENRTVRKKTVVDILEKQNTEDMLLRTYFGGRAVVDMLWRIAVEDMLWRTCCRGHAVEDLLWRTYGGGVHAVEGSVVFHR
jgi:hypothetical protein